MSTKDTSNKLDKIVLEARSNRNDRDKGYREKSLNMYPWVCGRCAREYTRINLRELTVHHRDHNHDNNPEDGSNWELLCVYCHDNEHSQYANTNPKVSPAGEKKSTATHNPFANLANLLKDKT